MLDYWWFIWYMKFLGWDFFWFFLSLFLCFIPGWCTVPDMKKQHKSNSTLLAGSLSEWKGILISHCGFTLDMMTLLMALGHYFMTWWLHGLAFHLIDVVLFLKLRVSGKLAFQNPFYIIWANCIRGSCILVLKYSFILMWTDSY